MRAFGPRRALVGALLLAAVGSVAGCTTKDSLIVVTASVVPDYYASNLHTLVVTAGGTSQSFPIPADITAGAVTVGLYVPSSLTGPNIEVTAQAVGSSIACGPGYSGNALVDIPAAGATVQATIIMNDATTCPLNLGTGGTHGAAGAGGKGGTLGTAGATGTAGAIGVGGKSGTGGTTGATVANCVEIDHEAAGTCATCTTGATGDMAVFGVAFSPTNPQLVVTGSAKDPVSTQGSVKVWTIGANGALTAAGHQFSGTGLNVVAFSPDGSALAIGRTGRVDMMQVSNWSAGTSVTNIAGGGDVYGVGFSPDATMLIVLSVLSTDGTVANSTGTLAAYPASTPQTPFTATIPEGYALAVSPVTVGGVLPVAVTTANGYMEVFNLTANGFASPATVSVTSTSTYVETAAFAPKGDVLAAGGDDGFLRFWSVPVAAAQPSDASPVNINANTFSSQVWSAAFSPDEKYIAIGGGGFSTGGGFGSLSLWNASAPRAELGTGAQGEFDTKAGYDVVSVAYSPSGNLIVGGEADCGCVLVCPQ